MSIDPLAYFAQPGPVTVLPTHDPVIDALLVGLPPTVPGIVEAVRGNILHIFWAERYGVTLSDERKAEVNIRSADAMLRRIHAVDPTPLTVARPHEKKLVGNCRDFTVLAVALLQRAGIPARARCGFGTYFRSDGLWHEDHWVAEYWNAEQQRWIMVDAQLDAFQVEQLKTDFDPFDVPRDRFVTGGHAWQKVRQQQADPQTFGIFDLRGLWFILGDLIRDVAALNKMPLLPWDSWGAMLEAGPGGEYSPETLELMDYVAALTLENDRLDPLRALYESDERLRVPPVIMSFSGGPEPERVTLADELPRF